MKCRPQLHYCYFLLSEAKKKASYVGYSVNPCRRLRQHNGEIKKGAKKTKNGAPWNLGICVGGFPNRVAALRFEWAWQHPNICKATRACIESWRIVKNKRPSNARPTLNKRQWSIQQRISILVCMITIEPWKDMDLTVFVFKDELETNILEIVESVQKLKLPINFSHPNILTEENLLMFLFQGEDRSFENGTKFLKCDLESFRDLKKAAFSCDSDSNIEDNSGVLNLEALSPSQSVEEVTCTLCQKKIEANRNYLEFPCCTGMTVHLSCIYSWGESDGLFDDSEKGFSLFKEVVAPLVPTEISCPCCFQTFSWERARSEHVKVARAPDLSRPLSNLTDASCEFAEKENLNPEKNSQADFLAVNGDNLEIEVQDYECLQPEKEMSPSREHVLFPEDEFSEISQKCECIDLTVDSD
ncbi:structure-specific endonuclease subunit SLX1 [Cryptosporidium felis]|nr:structure-specific endonuclease subunit SLX1 [Cryptosporidium felis]